VTQHPDSAAILIIRPGCYNAGEHTITEAMKLAVMMNEVLMLENDNVVIAGQVSEKALTTLTSYLPKTHIFR
jgi:predicted Fe-Mo cluster-binding NifX family protein